MQYILLVFISGLGSVQTLLNKHYSRATTGIQASKSIFSWVNAAVSCIFYGALAGFFIRVNEGILFYSFLYAVAAIVSSFHGIFVSRRVPLSKVVLFSSGGALVIPYAVDVCFLGGSITFYKTAAVLLFMVIFLLPFMDKAERSGDVKEYLYCTVSFFLGGMGTVICKLFTLSENPLGNGMFCFWTNVIMLPILLAVTLFTKDRKHILSDIGKVGVKNILSVVAVSFIGTLATPLMLSVLGEMNVTVYTICSGALSLLFAALMSVFVFRERLEMRTVVGMCLAVGAIVLSAI